MPFHKPLLRKAQLRKSPVRTRALLSANRANALKSTGPRTARGKHASALNALRHGRRAQISLCWVPPGGREAEAFWRFEARLRDAVLPLAGPGEQRVFEQALRLWITKRLYDRLAASVDDDLRMQFALGLEPLPASFRLRTRRPGITVPDWTVTVSIGMAWGRGLGRFQQFATGLAGDLAAEAQPTPRSSEPGTSSPCRESTPSSGCGGSKATSGGRGSGFQSRCAQPGPGAACRPMPRLPSLHTRLVLTTVGHPYSDNLSGRQGTARLEGGRGNRQTKPESARKHRASENGPAMRHWFRRTISGLRKLIDRRLGGSDEKDAAPRRESGSPTKTELCGPAGRVRLREETG